MRKTSIDNGNSQILREIIREREIALSLNKEPCILWVRVSTAKTEQDKSLLDQQALAQEYAEKNGFHVCYCWAVRETASKAKDRKSFQSLVAILNNDNVGITHVICKNRKRLNRNLDDRVVLDQLIRKGVTFHYFITGEKDHMSRTANDRLVRNILTAIDCTYWRKISGHSESLKPKIINFIVKKHNKFTVFFGVIRLFSF